MDDEKDSIQLSIPADQAGLYVADGWTHADTTPDGRVLVRKKFRMEDECNAPGSVGFCGACGGKNSWRGIRDNKRGVIAYACTCGHSWERAV